MLQRKLRYVEPSKTQCWAIAKRHDMAEERFQKQSVGLRLVMELLVEMLVTSGFVREQSELKKLPGMDEDVM